MNKLTSLLSIGAFTFSALLMISCSSGGGGGGGNDGIQAGVSYSGNTAPAAIDASNVQDIGQTAGESVQKADDSANTSTGLPGAISITGPDIDMDLVNDMVLSTGVSAASLPDLPTGTVVDVSADVCNNHLSGGSASADVTGNLNTLTGPFDLDITYNNCQVVSTAISATGRAFAHFNDFSNPNAGFSIKYTNFKVTDSSGTTTINMTVICSDTLNCTFNSDFMGSDGKVHRISGFSNITGDALNGYYGNATLLHSTHGQVDITYTNITFGNCGLKPDGGTIDMTSTNGSSGQIIFAADCSDSGSWNDGITGGTF